MRFLSGLAAGTMLLAIFAMTSLTAYAQTAGWSPTEAVPGSWRLVLHDKHLGTLAVANEVSCDLRQSAWYLAPERVVLTVKTASCPDDTAAKSYSFDFRTAAGGSSAAIGNVFGANVDTVYTIKVKGKTEYGRAWAQGSRVFTVIVQCGSWSLPRCVQNNRLLSVSLAKSEAETPEQLRIDGQDIVGESVAAVPLLAWIFIVGIPGIIRVWRRDRYAIPTRVGRFVDVDGDVRRLRRRSVLWGLVVGMRRFCLGYAALAVAVLIGKPSVSVAVGFMAAGLLWLALVPLSRKLSDPLYSGTVHSVRGGRLGTLRVVGYGLRIFGWLLIVPFAVAYVESVLLWSTGGSSGLLVTLSKEGLDSRIFAGQATASDYLRLAALEFLSSPQIVFVVLLVVVTIALAFDRLGLRCQVRSAAESLQRDNRRPLLYLRNFGDDKVRVRASRISRRGLLGRLSPRHTRPFEEVVAWRLNRFGPVVAVNDPRGRLARLGAAKMTLDQDDWHEKVEQLAADSLAVVMSAAPDELNPGLRWEIEMLATRLPHQRLVLLLPPRRKPQLIAGWEIFSDFVARWSLFDEARRLNRTVAGQVLVHVPGEGWSAWGSTVRSEWTYAVAVQRSLAYATARWADQETTLAQRMQFDHPTDWL